ncbi:glycosyltransferase family 2 protein [Bacteroidota bacterium]
MDLSIVISLYNEEESLPELLQWIHKVCHSNNYNYEIILIDDGSNDNSWNIIEKFSKESENIRAIKFKRNYGKSAALFSGFEAAKGDVVITMDADLQDNPEEIPELMKMIYEGNYDLVSGWKKKRHDPFLTKKLPSKFYNWTARRITGIKLHDFNCGLKAYKNDVIKNIEVFGEMHRYIPVLAKKAGFNNIGEKVVSHQKRKYGVSKFGIERFINGVLDLITISFLSKFSKRPMHFFGLLGTIMFILGGLTTVWIIVQKLIRLHNSDIVRSVTDQPLFFLALVAVIIGVQLFLAGFIAELLSRSSQKRNEYFIEKKI